MTLSTITTSFLPVRKRITVYITFSGCTQLLYTGINMCVHRFFEWRPRSFVIESWLADLLHVVTDLSSPLAPQQQQRPCWPEAPEVDHFIFVNGGYPQRTVIVESHRLSEFFPGAIQSDSNQPRLGVRSHLLVCKCWPASLLPGGNTSHFL